MSEELAREIEAGGGTDEAVALALGWYPLNAGGEWCGPGEKGGYSLLGPPAFLTDLNAGLAECERRGWVWEKTHHPDGNFYIRVWGGDIAATPWVLCRGRTRADDARALAAALVRAAGASE